MSSLPDLQPARRHVERAVGVDQLAQSITGWEQVYDQTSPGRFHGELIELLLGPAQVFAESSSHALVQICKTWPKAVWFGIPGQLTHPGRIEGIPIEHGMLAVRTGSSDFQLTTPDNFIFLGVVVEMHALQQHAAVRGGGELSQAALEQRVLKVTDAALQSFRRHLCDVLQASGSLPDAQLTAAVRSQILDDTLARLEDMLMFQQEAPRDAVSAQHARRTVRRARDYLQANDDRCVTVHELCGQLGASRRALQDCFRRSMDLTPKAYLRAFGLNAARRELRRADSPCATVSDAATRHGFWHLSQFATDYRRMFGELPSETLRQRKIHADS